MAHPNVRVVLALVAVSLVVLGLAPSASAGTKTLYCYSAAYDRDGDGYAVSTYMAVSVTITGITYRTVTVPAVELTVDSSRLNCPSGYVNENGDCDDTNPAIHPRRGEIAFNGVDDNCNGKTDESEWVYSAAGNATTEDGFRLTLRVNGHAVLDAAPDLWIDVRYSPLTDTSTTSTVSTQVASISPLLPFVTVSLTGLAPSTVYRARATLKRGDGTVLETTPYYFTTTEAASFWGEPQGATRTKIVLRALKEYDESERGRVGYRGSVAPDGTRYGASLNEKWCTEFYAWVTDPWFAYSPYFTTTNTDGMSAFFASHGDWYGWSYVASLARRGDYLGIDTDGDADINHSGMVLAVDRAYSPAQVWTVEGNIDGHRVNVKRRVPGDAIRALGRITADALE